MISRLEQLEQNDPTLTPLLARAVTEFGRRQSSRAEHLPARPLDVTSDTFAALILCADGWSLEEIEQCLAARKAQAPQELSSNQRRWLAEAYDVKRVGAMPGESPSLLHTVYLARSGTRLEVWATGWREALEQVDEPDACLVERTGDRTYDTTLLLDGEPLIINTRVRTGTEEEALRWTLANAARAVDANAGAGGAA
ncbi:hypothetical protein HOP61_03040 [Halomonas daqingensis]|uniref:Uncharacterized protein n=1 Tax=Billgrantia desiderata TaxID=52021 RepID=A0AAW4YR03_9GAMM|nr:hypothetical protein [Halomonas desiderata]MCE8050268.1 hypothetical protein [Halomonas desiderata]